MVKVGVQTYITVYFKFDIIYLCREIYIVVYTVAARVVSKRTRSE